MTLTRELHHDGEENNRLAELICKAPIGSYIGAEGSRILATHACTERLLNENDYLFRQGEITSSFFLVEEGRLARVRESARHKTPTVIHTMERGDLVGELSFIDGTEHAHGVLALSPAIVLEFKRADVEPLILAHPQLMFDFMRAIIKRVHHTSNEISRQQMALADFISTGGKGRS